MAWFWRRPDSIAHREMGDPAPAPHAAVSVRDLLAPGEVIHAVIECRQCDGTGEIRIVITDEDVLFVDAEGDVHTFALESLNGMRTKAEFMSLGFRSPAGATSVMTAYVGGSQQLRALHMSLAGAWIRKTRKPFPAADLTMSPEVPEISVPTG
jgi:hypothetical protein